MIVFSKYEANKLNAGPKAKVDIENILKENFNSKIITFKYNSKYEKNIVLNSLYKIYKMIYIFSKFAFLNKNDTIIIQHPATQKRFFIKKFKTKVILIHDIEGLRFQEKEKCDSELSFFNEFDYIIVHNNKMKEYLENNNIPSEKIYVLGVFDYLTTSTKEVNNNYTIKDLKLFYPGNLSKEKSPFIHQLDEKKLKYTINLYGKGIEKDINSKLVYKGTFKPDNIGIIEGDIGLIWDGNFDESDENVTFKNYTKYNNPHKLSCCLALGIPVIVWKKAAIADFVKENNIGYTISNIYEINNLDFSDYEEKRNNAITIGNNVRNGNYTKEVINKILNNIKR